MRVHCPGQRQIAWQRRYSHSRTAKARDAEIQTRRIDATVRCDLYLASKIEKYVTTEPAACYLEWHILSFSRFHVLETGQ